MARLPADARPLPPHARRVACSAVCRTWRDLGVQASGAWEELKLEGLAAVQWAAAAVKRWPAGTVRSVSAHVCASDSPGVAGGQRVRTALTAVLEQSANELRALALVGDAVFKLSIGALRPAQRLLTTLSTCTRLERLELEFCPSGVQSRLLKADGGMPHLTHLSINPEESQPPLPVDAPLPPTLHSLAFRADELPACLTLLTGLESLTVYGPIGDEGDAHFSCLGAMSQVRRRRFGGLHWPARMPPPHTRVPAAAAALPHTCVPKRCALPTPSSLTHSH